MNWGQAAKNMAQLGAYGARRAWGNPTARAGLIGAGVGGAYGAYSDNGSLMGGAMKGALLGAGAYRYGIRPAMAVNRMGIGAGMGLRQHATAMGRAYMSAVGRSVRYDFRGAKMLANRPINAIRGLRRQAGFGFGGIG